MSTQGFERITAIVGAGASVSYGFPLGFELAREIRFSLHREFVADEDGPIRAALECHKPLSDTYRKAAWVLANALLLENTIDHTLAVRRSVPGLLDVGKVAIATVIARCEASSVLARLSDFHASHSAFEELKNSWLAVLVREIVGDRETDFETLSPYFRRIDFIIFNYDRNVEYFLEYAFRELLNWSVDQIRSLLSEMTFLHVFGDLGRLKVLGGSSEFGEITGSCLDVAKSIITYKEKYEDGERVVKIRALVERSTKIVWLGFGFAPENVDLLLGDAVPTASHFASCHQMSEARKQQITERLGSVRFYGTQVENMMKGEKIAEALFGTLTPVEG